jgi:sulfur-carrier protein
LRVEVKLFASLTKYYPGAESEIPFGAEIPEGSTISDLMDILKLPENEVKLSFVNGQIQPVSYKLKNNDNVGIFPPIGGG